MLWAISNRADPVVARLADRHYSRQTPGARQFAPPGECLVLRSATGGKAAWVTVLSRYADHAWPGAMVCTLFRNESRALSSDLIRDAVAATRWRWGDATPPVGIITFVNADKVESANPGYCFLRAGFKRVGYSKVAGLHVLQMRRDDMGEAIPPLGTTRELLAV